MKKADEAFAAQDRPAYQGNKINAVGMNGDGVTNAPCCPEEEATSPWNPGGGLDTEDVLGSIFQRMGMPEDGAML